MTHSPTPSGRRVDDLLILPPLGEMLMELPTLSLLGEMPKAEGGNAPT